MPFALLSITPWIIGGHIGETAIIFQIAYGSIILTFLGGISWGWRDDQPQQKKNLSIGILYSLIACLMLILIYLNMILFALLISIISFQSFYYFEKSTYDFKNKHEDYQRFRRMLSLLVAISFLISTAYWINPYSNPLN
jgi:hypothetical protein